MGIHLRDLSPGNKQGTVNNQLVTNTVSTNNQGALETAPASHYQETPSVPEEDASKQQIGVYREFLKENGISDEDIFVILDHLLTTGSVAWSFKLLDRIEVVFRMRPAWVNEYLLEQLESQDPKILTRFTDLVSRINLAGSLVQYGSEKFEVQNPDSLKKVELFDFKSRLYFPNKIGSAVSYI